MRSTFAFGPLLLVSALAGCGGSREKPDNTAWQTRDGYRGLGVDDSGEVDVSGDAGGFSGFDWHGVRHDLAINPDRKQSASCTCLAVEVGNPNDTRFIWRGVRPDLNPVNVALAISAFGVDCPGGAPNAADRRPSIRGVERVGKDIVVEIEELAPDRPIATGAIIRPPDHGGHVYVRARNKNLPYARTTGKDLCRVK